MPISGITMGYFGGKGLPFFGYTIPGAEEKDGALAKSAFIWHKRAGTVLEYLVPIHVGAVGLHMMRGHKILARMNPFV
jgi:cytochrome b561